MLRTLLVLGPLVLVAMLAHSIMVSAQPISAEMLQVEPREISNLLPLIHTLEPRRPTTAAQTATLERQSLANALRTNASEYERAATSMFRSPPGTFSFELWKSNSDSAIETLVELQRVTQERAHLLQLRLMFLQQYITILARQGPDHRLTKADKQGAEERAVALLHMDAECVHWKRALARIQALVVEEKQSPTNLAQIVIILGFWGRP